MTSRENRYHKFNKWAKSVCYKKEVHNGYTFVSTRSKIPKEHIPVELRNSWMVSIPTVVKHNNGTTQVINKISFGIMETDQYGKVRSYEIK